MTTSRCHASPSSALLVLKLTTYTHPGFLHFDNSLRRECAFSPQRRSPIFFANLCDRNAPFPPKGTMPCITAGKGSAHFCPAASWQVASQNRAAQLARGVWCVVSSCCYGKADDTLAERLRRRPAKPMGSPRVGSNPTGVVLIPRQAQVRVTCAPGFSCTRWRNTLPGRLELPTLRLTASRSNQLSYGSSCRPRMGDVKKP